MIKSLDEGTYKTPPHLRARVRGDTITVERREKAPPANKRCCMNCMYYAIGNTKLYGSENIQTICLNHRKMGKTMPEQNLAYYKTTRNSVCREFNPKNQ